MFPAQVLQKITTRLKIGDSIENEHGDNLLPPWMRRRCWHVRRSPQSVFGSYSIMLRCLLVWWAEPDRVWVHERALMVTGRGR